MKKLIKELETAREFLKEYTKIKHIFSDDEGIKTLANLNRTLAQISLHVKASDIKDLAHPENKAIRKGFSCKQGALVKIRPCGDEYKDKTFVGFYIGDVALGSSITLTDEKKIQLNFEAYNPAIFVPKLGKIIYGCASWWGKIESEKDLKDITDSDIENVWYVKALKEMLEKDKNKKDKQ